MPAEGRSREHVLQLLDQLTADDLRWREGVPVRAFPSLARIQSDLPAITLDLVHAPGCDGLVTTIRATYN